MCFEWGLGSLAILYLKKIIFSNDNNPKIFTHHKSYKSCSPSGKIGSYKFPLIIWKIVLRLELTHTSYKLIDTVGYLIMIPHCRRPTYITLIKDIIRVVHDKPIPISSLKANGLKLGSPSTKPKTLSTTSWILFKIIIYFHCSWTPNLKRMKRGM